MSRLTQPLALHIIERMGSAGQPPVWGIFHVNSGNEELLSIIEEEYFKKNLKLGSSFKLVQGYYGGGKTHFLYCIKELSWKYNFITSIIELSPKECPFDDPLKVYKAVARNLQLPINLESQEAQDLYSSPLAMSVTGIGELLRSIIDDKVRKLGDGGKVLSWLHTTVRRYPVESLSFRRALIKFCEAYMEEDHEIEEIAESWLMGEKIPIQRLKDSIGINEVIDKGNAFVMLRTLTQMSLALGFQGTTIMFDEVDRNLSLSPKRKQELGDNLRQLIDQCGKERFRSTFILYAVPPEFIRDIVPEYPALAQRLLPPLPQIVKRSPNSVIIDLEALDIQPYDLLMKIGEKITNVYSVAYNVKFEPGMITRLLTSVVSHILNTTFDINHRRLFVRCWIQVLHQIRDGGVSTTTISIEELLQSLIKSMNMDFEEQ